MPKSTKHAALICIVLTVVAGLGVAIGIWKGSPLAAIIGVVPAVIYEVYRTEGFTTKLASVGMLLVLVALIVMIAMKLSFSLAPYLSKFGITRVVDAKLAGPVIIAVLAVILLRRTAGIYTKWLAVVIFLAAVGLFYVLDPSIFQFILNLGAKEGMKRVGR